MSRPFPSAPVLSVSVLCHKDGSALLIKRGKPPYKDHWSLPGGKVEFGETLAEAAARELRSAAEGLHEFAVMLHKERILGQPTRCCPFYFYYCCVCWWAPRH